MPAEDGNPAEREMRRSLRLLGGRACLDFVNTVDPRIGKNRRDFLRGYGDLIAWGRFAGIVTPAEGKRLHALSEQHPQQAARAFRKCTTLRELLYGIFGTVATGEQPQAADLHTLRTIYADALRHAELRPSSNGFAWHWPEDADSLERIGWLLAQSAIELLASPQIGRVKICASPEGCGWLFLDTSKNGSRRWCSMEVCGSRAKMRRLYARRKKTTSA